MQLHPYLNFGGNCRQAFEFYQEHLGGKITSMITHAQTPGGPAIAENWRDAILHARMTIGETELLGSDVPADRFQPVRSVYLSLSVDTEGEAKRIYDVMAEDGQIVMALQKTFFSPAFAMVRDRFGVSWMINTEFPHGIGS
jgi:PhnB protein